MGLQFINPISISHIVFAVVFVNTMLKNSMLYFYIFYLFFNQGLLVTGVTLFFHKCSSCSNINMKGFHVFTVDINIHLDCCTHTNICEELCQFSTFC